MSQINRALVNQKLNRKKNLNLFTSYKQKLVAVYTHLSELENTKSPSGM